MKKRNVLASAVVVAMSLSACTTPPKVTPTSVSGESLPVKAAENCCEHQQPKPQLAKMVPVEQPKMVVTYEAPVMPKPVKVEKPQILKITGIGYGAESTYEGYTPGQRRLMAIRSSKLDAYRSLAEQIYGIKIDSNTSVATLTAKSDSYRARVNAVVRGARIISVTPMADNNYETVLEVYVDKAFFEKTFVYSGAEADYAVEPESLYQMQTFR